MSDAPERIWVQREFHEACVRGSACIHETARHAIGYIREDVHASALIAKDAEIARLREALQNIAAEASVPVSTWQNGINFKKMYEGWRKLATIRVNIARAALNTQHKGETP